MRKQPQTQGTGLESLPTESQEELKTEKAEILRYLARLRKTEGEFYLYLLGRERALGAVVKVAFGSFGSWLDSLHVTKAREWLDFKAEYGQLNGYLTRHPVTLDGRTYLTDEVVVLLGTQGVKRLRRLRKAENLPGLIRDLVDHARENQGVRPADETVRLKQQLRGVVPYESLGDKRVRRDSDAETEAKDAKARARAAEAALRDAERQRDLAEQRAAQVEIAILKPIVSVAPSNASQSEAERLEADLRKLELEIRSTEATLKIMRQRAKTVRGELEALRPVATAS